LGSTQYYQVPYQRYGHTAVVYNDMVYVWGGRNDDSACNILFCFDTNTQCWSRPKVLGQVPGARDGHSACVIDHFMYVFGGYEEDIDQFSQDVHMLDLRSMEWSHLKPKGDPPSYRDFHSATAIGNFMYVFGGRGDQSGPLHSQEEVYCDQIMYLDTKMLLWHKPDVTGFHPLGRRSHSAFSYNNCLFIFGGFNGICHKHYNDLLRYDPQNCRWSVVKPRGIGPCARRRQSCCVVDDKVFLFGGTSPHPDANANGVSISQGYLQIPEEETRLMDHNDLFVLDFAPSLKTLTIRNVIEHKLNIEALPESIRWEIRAMTLPNTVTKPLNNAG